MMCEECKAEGCITCAGRGYTLEKKPPKGVGTLYERVLNERDQYKATLRKVMDAYADAEYLYNETSAVGFGSRTTSQILGDLLLALDEAFTTEDDL